MDVENYCDRDREREGAVASCTSRLTFQFSLSFAGCCPMMLSPLSKNVNGLVVPSGEWHSKGHAQTSGIQKDILDVQT